MNKTIINICTQTHGVSDLGFSLLMAAKAIQNPDIPRIITPSQWKELTGSSSSSNLGFSSDINRAKYIIDLNNFPMQQWETAQKLKRVLTELSVRHPYLQQYSHIASFLLLHMPEHCAYWLMNVLIITFPGNDYARHPAEYQTLIDDVTTTITKKKLAFEKLPQWLIEMLPTYVNTWLFTLFLISPLTETEKGATLLYLLEHGRSALIDVITGTIYRLQSNLIEPKHEFTSENMTIITSLEPTVNNAISAITEINQDVENHGFEMLNLNNDTPTRKKAKKFIFF